jgi:ammonium transporter, Amt family
VIRGVDAFWLIFAGALVYFMQPGFAMLCAGSIRAKNAKNVILWSLLDSAGGGLAYWAFGYAFSYGGDNVNGPKTFIGNTNFFLMNNDVQYEFWFFQFAFASALSSIVAGTIAERAQMIAYLFYSVFLVGFVYPVVSYFSILRCFPAFIQYLSHTSPFSPNRLPMPFGPTTDFYPILQSSHFLDQGL